MFELHGRTAIVTGAGSGIGRGVAEALGGAGASIVAVGRRRDPLEETCQAITDAGGLARAASADVTDAAAIADVVASCTDGVDILVTAAAVQLRKPALDISEEEWSALIAVNLGGVFLASQAAARAMPRGGSIVTITSLTERIGLPKLAAYGAAKGGVAQLTKALAVEWAPLGIRVNAVAPGRIRTPLSEELFGDDNMRESFLARIPQGRAGSPADVGAAVIYLCSDEAAYVTGETLVVDGGWLASGGAPLG